MTHLQFAFWGSIEQMRIEQSIVAEYERLHPETKVDMLRIGARYAEKLTAAIVGRSGPDVMLMSIDAYYDWAARGVLLDVSAELAALDRESPLMPIPRLAAQLHGVAYGLPINAHAPCLFYNKEALRRAGVEIPPEGISWAWFEQIAPRLAKRTGNPAAPVDYVMVSPDALTLLTSFGGRCFDALDHPGRVTVASPETEAAMNYVRRLDSSGAFIPTARVTDTSNLQAPVQLFRDQKVAFHLNGRWELPNIAGRVDFEWGVLPPPSGPGGSVTVHYGTMVGVCAQTKQPAAAKEFMRFYASRTAARLAMKGGRTVPVSRELAYGDEFLGLAPAGVNRAFADTMEQGHSIQMFYGPGLLEARKIFFARFEQLSAEPTVPVPVIMRALADDLTRWLEREKRKGYHR